MSDNHTRRNPPEKHQYHIEQEELTDESEIVPEPDLRLSQLQRAPQRILKLQRIIGNQAVQRLLSSSSASDIQRQNGADDSGNESGGRRTIRMLLATGMHDEIGHAWVIFEHSNGYKETWGFYPTDFEAMGSTYTNPVPGRVRHPDPHHDDEPTTTYGYMINHEQYRRAVRYANRQGGREYRLNEYNCAAFARGMLEAATGDPGPRLPFLGDAPITVAGASFVYYLQRLFGIGR